MMKHKFDVEIENSMFFQNIFFLKFWASRAFQLLKIVYSVSIFYITSHSFKISCGIKGVVTFLDNCFFYYALILAARKPNNFFAFLIKFKKLKVLLGLFTFYPCFVLAKRAPKFESNLQIEKVVILKESND